MSHDGGVRAEELILERAQEDFEEGLEWVRQRVRSMTHQPPMIGRAIDMGLVGAVGMLHLRPRHREDVQMLLGLARRVHAGEDASRLAGEHLHRVLRLRELALVARVRDPQFQPVLDVAHRIFAARLPDLARMVAVEAPRDYPDLVTRAFPDAKYVEAFVEDNRERMHQILAHLEAHPRLLRIPASWVAPVAAIARDVVEWEAQRVTESVRAMYDRAT